METARLSETRQTTNIYGVETHKNIYRIFTHLKIPKILHYMGADKSLARPGRKQIRATEDFDFHISYL
jgi:hypothetical protein